MDTQKNDRTTRYTPAEPGRRYVAKGFDSARRPSTTEQVLSHVSAHDVKPPVKKTPKRTPNPVKPALARTEKSKVLRRQMVERAKLQRQKTRKSYGKHVLVYSAIGVTLLAAVLILWSFQGLLPSGLQFFSNSQPETPVNRPIIQETSTLDETEPSAQDVAQHKMGAEEPRVLKIPKLGVEARIKRVGVSLSGEPISTGNIFDVGWFEAGGRPGIDGAVLLNGHVAGPSKQGIFGQIRTLVPGDKLLLSRGDGMELTYTVVKVQEYTSNSVDMNAATQPIDPSRHGLNLMTTVNKYPGNSSQPDKRVMVFALH